MTDWAEWHDLGIGDVKIERRHYRGRSRFRARHHGLESEGLTVPAEAGTIPGALRALAASIEQWAATVAAATLDGDEAQG